MDVKLLEDIGLTKPQAVAYLTLVERGKSTAPEIAKATGESRSNTYKLLDKLCELGLAIKDETTTKVHYFPTSPAALEQLVHKEVTAIELRERKLKAAMPDMLDFYFKHSEQPSIRYFQGKEGIQQIFTEMLREGETLHLLRTTADIPFFEYGFFAELLKKRALLGIKTRALTPDVPDAAHDPERDKRENVERTWLDAAEYTAPVEWNICGNKVAIISYGEDAVGIVIENPQIAESFRQVFQLVVANRPATPAV